MKEKVELQYKGEGTEAQTERRTITYLRLRLDGSDYLTPDQPAEKGRKAEVSGKELDCSL